MPLITTNELPMPSCDPIFTSPMTETDPNITMVEANYLKSFKSMLKGVGKATDLQQEDVTIAQNDLQGYEKAMEMAKESLNSIDNKS